MITVHLPRDVAGEVGAPDTVETPFEPTLGELLRRLERSFPGLLQRLLEADGAIRPHINVFAGERLARTAGGAAMALQDGETIWVMRAISGG